MTAELPDKKLLLPHNANSQGTIRPAVLADLPALLQLEANFTSDKISARSFRYFLLKANADVLVFLTEGRIVADIVLLYRRNTVIARIYSLIVSPNFQQRGIARALLQAAEQTAKVRGCRHMRLELRPDNLAALSLYRNMVYDVIHRKENYYEDQSDALCMQKSLSV